MKISLGIQYTPVKWTLDNWNFCLMGQDLHVPLTCGTFKGEQLHLTGTWIRNHSNFEFLFAQNWDQSVNVTI